MKDGARRAEDIQVGDVICISPIPELIGKTNPAHSQTLTDGTMPSHLTRIIVLIASKENDFFGIVRGTSRRPNSPIHQIAKTELETKFIEFYRPPSN